MSDSFSRSIWIHCLPGPSSTHEPSSPSLSPSVTRSSVPTTGSLSLAVTFLPFAKLTVPAGTRKSGRPPASLGSRFGTLIGTGVPTKSGLGNSVFSGTLSSASATDAVSTTATVSFEIRCFIKSSFGFFGGEGNQFFFGGGLVRLVDDIFAGERLVAGAVQFRLAFDGVEKILQMRHVRRLVERHGNFKFLQLRGFAHVHLGGIGGDGGRGLGADVIFFDDVIPRGRARLAVNRGQDRIFRHLQRTFVAHEIFEVAAAGARRDRKRTRLNS